MSKQEVQLAELSLLMEALCEERLTAEEQQRLEEIVLSNPDAMQYYLNYAHLHGTLYWDQALGSDAEMAVASPVTDSELPVLKQPHDQVRRRSLSRAGLAATAVLGLVVVVWYVFRGPSTEPQLAD
ncbi:MAG: hypothetical protein RLO18_02740, partial [Gimesia chilikensis]